MGASVNSFSENCQVQELHKQNFAGSLQYVQSFTFLKSVFCIIRDFGWGELENRQILAYSTFFLIYIIISRVKQVVLNEVNWKNTEIWLPWNMFLHFDVRQMHSSKFCQFYQRYKLEVSFCFLKQPFYGNSSLALCLVVYWAIVRFCLENGAWRWMDKVYAGSP